VVPVPCGPDEAQDRIRVCGSLDDAGRERERGARTRKNRRDGNGECVEE